MSPARTTSTHSRMRMPEIAQPVHDRSRRRRTSAPRAATTATPSTSAIGWMAHAAVHARAAQHADEQPRQRGRHERRHASTQCAFWIETATLMNATIAAANVSQSSQLITSRGAGRPPSPMRRVAMGCVADVHACHVPTPAADGLRASERSSPLLTTYVRISLAVSWPYMQQRRRSLPNVLGSISTTADLHAALRQRLHRRQPRVVGRRRNDDQRGVAAESSLLLHAGCSPSGASPDRVRRGERLEDARESVAHRVPPPPHAGRFPNVINPTGRLLIEVVPGDARGHAHAVLLGALVVLAEVHSPLEVEDHPDVARRVEFERLHHHLPGTCRALPMDAVEAIARGIFADAARVWRDVVRAPPEAALAGQVRRRRLEVGQVQDRRVHEDLALSAHVSHASKYPERVRRRHAHGPPVVQPAPQQRRRHHPVARTPRRDDHHPPRTVAGQPARVLDFHPELWQEVLVTNFDDLDRLLPHLASRSCAARRRVDVARVPPGDEPRHRAAPARMTYVTRNSSQNPVAVATNAEIDDDRDHRRQRAPFWREPWPDASQHLHRVNCGPVRPVRAPGSSTVRPHRPRSFLSPWRPGSR